MQIDWLTILAQADRHSEPVLIDWFTTVAQIFNFLILVALLRYFLYRPIIRAMDRREQKIAQRLQDTKHQKQQAEQEAAHYRRRNEEFTHEREQMLAEARQQAHQLRDEMTERAREEVRTIEQRWRQTILNGQQTFLRHLRERAIEEVINMTRRTLRDLADTDLETQLVHAFVDRIKQADSPNSAHHAETTAPDRRIHVHTSFDVQPELQEHITNAIHERFDSDYTIEFRQDANVICGIEATISGRKFAWSIDHYLTDLEDRLRAVVESQTQPIEDTDQQHGKQDLQPEKENAEQSDDERLTVPAESDSRTDE